MWNTVPDSLPKIAGTYLFYSEEIGHVIAYFKRSINGDYAVWYNGRDITNSVTLWQELDPLPNGYQGKTIIYRASCYHHLVDGICEYCGFSSELGW